MQIIRDLNKIDKLPSSVLAIGNFDGMHLGHEKIIAKLGEIASKNNLASAILTFHPHPIKLFKPDLAQHFTIQTLAQKIRNFTTNHINYFTIATFNQRFADIHAQTFIDEILIKKLNVKELIVGYDFIFGKNRSGNIKLLEENAQRYGFNITKVLAHEVDNQICSSTLVRKLIQNGEILQANKILGKNFAVDGFVLPGKKLAHTIGFPTANIGAKPHIVKPKFGVYKSQILIDGQSKKSITNFGVKPTIGEVLQPLYETHIFDFEQEIYGKRITIELLDFIREEKKFDSLTRLRMQIEEDIQFL